MSRLPRTLLLLATAALATTGCSGTTDDDTVDEASGASTVSAAPNYNADPTDGLFFDGPLRWATLEAKERMDFPPNARSYSLGHVQAVSCEIVLDDDHEDLRWIAKGARVKISRVSQSSESWKVGGPDIFGRDIYRTRYVVGIQLADDVAESKPGDRLPRADHRIVCERTDTPPVLGQILALLDVQFKVSLHTTR